ncbi:MAG: CrcB family protein [Pseudanabaenaceae cyanobacterium bins.39]|nr:CrcB family protein [Pseudanabaenaceae cyanobacterium bins.39]
MHRSYLQKRYALAVAIGAIGGALSRFYLTKGITALWGHDLRFCSTAFINVSGCLLIAYILTLATEDRRLISPELRLMTTTGFCGAYTSFSTYGLEAREFLIRGDFAMLLIYFIGSAIAGMIGIYIGVCLARGKVS